MWGSLVQGPGQSEGLPLRAQTRVSLRPPGSPSPGPASPASADSEAPQAAKSRNAVAAAPARVPTGRVHAALGLRLLAPARLRRPHLLGPQHPQEALAPGRGHRRRVGGVPAHRRELRPRLPGDLQKNSHTEETPLSFFFFFKMRDWELSVEN